MKFLTVLFGLAVLPLAAGSIDVSTQTTTVLQTGDSLTFTLSARNFAFNSAPSEVVIQLLSLAVDPHAQLGAYLESADGLTSAYFSKPLKPVSGMFQGSAYHGAVSDFQAALYLPPGLSQRLFADHSVSLVLTNLGPEVSLGLAPYTLQQDLLVSLQAGNSSLGALGTGVRQNAALQTPEPGPTWLFFGGAVLFYVLAGALKRISHQCIQ